MIYLMLTLIGHLISCFSFVIYKLFLGHKNWRSRIYSAGSSFEALSDKQVKSPQNKSE
jgi:hypothetical protein